MVEDPVPDYLYAHRRTVAYPSGEQDIEKYVASNSVNYIMISPKLQTPRSNELDSFAEGRLVPLLRANPHKFVSVYANAFHNVTVYKVHADSQ